MTISGTTPFSPEGQCQRSEDRGERLDGSHRSHGRTARRLQDNHMYEFSYFNKNNTIAIFRNHRVYGGGLAVHSECCTG